MLNNFIKMKSIHYIFRYITYKDSKLSNMILTPDMALLVLLLLGRLDPDVVLFPFQWDLLFANVICHWDSEDEDDDL